MATGKRRIAKRFSIASPRLQGRDWEDARREVQQWIEVATSILDGLGQRGDQGGLQPLSGILTPATVEAGDPGLIGDPSEGFAPILHEHPVPVGVPVGLGDTNVAGVSKSLSRADHQHQRDERNFQRGAAFVSPAGALAIVAWRAPYPSLVLNVRGYRVGGTGATVNAQKNGASTHLASDLSLTSAATWMDGGAVQNATYAAGDSFEVLLQSVAGGPTLVVIQVDFRRTG